MAHIHSIQIDNNEYLIEPFMYAVAAGTGDAYTTTISDYDITANTLLFLTVPTNSLANATLSINSGTAVPIYYQNETVTSGLLKANQTYTLTYSNNRWNILNNLSDGETLIIDNDGGLEESNSGLKIKTGGVTNGMIADGTIANVKLVNSIITIAGNEVSLGGSISLSDLGLTQVLHFKGVAANDTLADGSKKDPFSTAIEKPNYNGDLGDVVIDIDKEFEYVWAGSTDGWIQLGGNASYKILQTTIADPTANGSTNAFIDSISQNANGEITVTKKYVSSWQYNRKVYTDLTNVSKATEINGGDSNATAIGIGIDGILPITNGGMGSDENEWNAGGIVYGKQNNNNQFYTSIAGLPYQILTSGGTGDPIWATAGLLESVVNNTPGDNNYTTLELGNDVDIDDTLAGHSEGRIVLYSAGTEAHLIKGNKTNIGYTHILPNANGYILQAPNLAGVGSLTQPIYINNNGIATPLTYTANRLYYSASTTSFEATNHYATSTSLAINDADTAYTESAPRPIYTFYVNGDSYFNGDTTHNGIDYFANGTTYYIDNSGDARLRNLGIGTAAINTSYALNIGGNVYLNGTHYFANGTTYYIDNFAIGYLSDLRVGNTRLVNSYLSFYSGANADGNRLGFIQGATDKMSFRIENGTEGVVPQFDFNGHILPSANNIGCLGASDKRWAKLYVGTVANYGDAYTSVYWNDGVPAAVTPVQYCAFTIGSGNRGVQLTHDAFTGDSYVLQIVVTEGESNLNSTISWESNVENGVKYIKLTCSVATSGAVSGYILVSRGGTITATQTAIT